MKLKEICLYLDSEVPLSFQESYDNSGLCTGDDQTEISGVLCCIDITEEVIDEAIQKNSNLIVSHHPLIFQGLKSVTNRTPTERLIIKAIRVSFNI